MTEEEIYMLPSKEFFEQYNKAAHEVAQSALWVLDPDHMDDFKSYDDPKMRLEQIQGAYIELLNAVYEYNKFHQEYLNDRSGRN